MNETPLHDLHVQLGARLVDFAGWHMPLVYTGIIEEHHLTRTSCTLFDVSHMGRLYLKGPDAGALLEKVCTRRMQDMVPGQCRYSHVCRPDGGILDDVIVSRLPDHWLMVCNASNRAKIVAWLNEHAGGLNLTLDDQTLQTAMIAVQGPRTFSLAEDLLPFDPSELKRYHLRMGKYLGIDFICSRTGYTGEDGFEIILPAAAGKMLATNLLDPEGVATGQIKPAGLGARDTLRLEAAMPLYGHELSEEVDSITAGQGWCVNLDKDFIGADSLRAVKQAGPQRALVGLELTGKKIARQDAPLLHQGQTVGVVTSGTSSPTLQKVIAMGFVRSDLAAPGTEIEADVRGARVPARVVPLPFYKRPKS